MPWFLPLFEQDARYVSADGHWYGGTPPRIFPAEAMRGMCRRMPAEAEMSAAGRDVIRPVLCRC